MHRLQQFSSELGEREAELQKLHDQLQAEVAAANAKAAAQQSEMAAERGLLTKQAAAIDLEREDFKAWCAERKGEMARQHKVRAGSSCGCYLEAAQDREQDVTARSFLLQLLLHGI